MTPGVLKVSVSDQPCLDGSPVAPLPSPRQPIAQRNESSSAWTLCASPLAASLKVTVSPALIVRTFGSKLSSLTLTRWSTAPHGAASRSVSTGISVVGCIRMVLSCRVVSMDAWGYSDGAKRDAAAEPALLLRKKPASITGPGAKSDKMTVFRSSHGP